MWNHQLKKAHESHLPGDGLHYDGPPLCHSPRTLGLVLINYVFGARGQVAIRWIIEHLCHNYRGKQS